MVLFSPRSYAKSASADYGDMRFQNGRISAKKRRTDGVNKKAGGKWATGACA
jgi:hypothetical protein